jgi:dUTP pyrophosphatase
MTLPVKLLDPDAFLPTRAHPEDAGLDLYARAPFTVGRGKQVRVGLGIAVGIPPGRVGLIRDRSGLAARGLHVLGGVVDAGYAGEVAVVIKNLSPADHAFERRDRVAQLLVVPVDLPEPVPVDELPLSARGDGGWGSTGV